MLNFFKLSLNNLFSKIFAIFIFFDLTKKKVIVQRVKKFSRGKSLFSDFVNFQWYYIVIRLYCLFIFCFMEFVDRM